MAIILLTFACSGGGSSNDGADDNSNGSDDSVVGSLYSGTIEGFGSIIVSGIKFETEGAEVEFENEGANACGPSADDDCGLRIGMMVTLENAFDDKGNPGTVSRIRYEDTVEGPIGPGVDTSAPGVVTLTVLGQTVVLQEGVTRFDDSDDGFDAFGDVGPGNEGNVVEVSGFIDTDGSIRATYIERKAIAPAAGDQYEVKGTVANLQPAANTFQVNGLVVDYSDAAPRNGTLEEGSLVEVKGNTLVGGTLKATDVEIKTGSLNVDDMAKVRVEGYVANLDTTANTFDVNGQAVDYSGAVFVGGSEADLAEGMKVEAEGPVAGGVLKAVKVEFEESIRFEANVAAIDAAAGTLTMQRFTGVTVQVDSLTVFDGFGSLSSLAPGNHLKIRGLRATPTGTTVTATRIELEDVDPDDRTTIQGPVDAFTAFNSVEILGVTVDTTTIGNDDFKDGDTVIGEATFFARLSTGSIVKARYDLDAGEWDQIEYEDD